MTREELKNLIIDRLEMVDDDDLIEYYNDTHEAKIYRDLNELFDEHCHSFVHALECLEAGFEYYPCGGYYGWNDEEICSADGITELIDLDDIAEIMLVDMEFSLRTASGYGDIDDITEEFLPEVKALKRADKIAAIDTTRQWIDHHVKTLDRLTKELEELA